MKILMLTRLYLPHIGGVELHISKLLKQKRPGDVFVIVSQQHEQSLPLHESADGVEIWRIPLRSDQSKKLTIWLWFLRHLSVVLSADVIHIHDVFFWMIPFRLLVPQKRMTITYHGYEGSTDPHWRQIFWHRCADFFTQGNLCIGGFHTKWYGVIPTEVSFGAVEVVSTPPAPKVGSKTRLLYAGRLSADAGILSYLRGLSSLPKKLRSTWTLDVYGDGECRSEAEALVTEDKLPVRFHGFVSPEQIHWRSYDVALVSRHLAILEALAHEIPVIADANCAIKYDYLRLSPFSDWIRIVTHDQEMHQALTQVLASSGDKGAAKRREAGRWARSQTWEKLYQQYCKLWEG